MTAIEQILIERGPLMSGVLAKQLSASLSIPENTASQRISRSQEVVKIKGFFSSQQSFCYLESHKKSRNLYDDLSKAMFDHGRKYWYCLNAIRLNNGMIPRTELECYTNYPIERLKGHKPFSDIISEFINAKIITYDGDCYYLAPGFTDNSLNTIKSRAVSQIQRTVLHDFTQVIRNIGLVSFNSAELFAEYGKFRWGIKGVSYVTGLKTGGSPGFVIGDILIGNPFYYKDVEFFVRKVEHILSFAKAPRLMPFLLVDNMDADALNELKKKGIIVGFIGELFGKKYADALNELIVLLSNVGASLSGTPDKFMKLIEELEVYNKTLIHNIKGSLFEYFVGHIIHKHFPNVDIGRIIYGDNQKHEIDVFAYNDDTVLIAECKATKSPIDTDDIRKWQRSVIPLVKKYLKTQDILSDKKIVFEYWSISEFTSSALKELDDFKNSVTVFTVNYYDTAAIKARVDQLKNKALSTTLNNYFLKSNL
ncbi:hypothetical protein [Phocaeicola paurosaccharolyticus]|uniref:hypothetical protein n=1 Tax=Phocaeicola paurosaccharolyticus TaxID=732242 RepID=UPI002FE1357A